MFGPIPHVTARQWLEDEKRQWRPPRAPDAIDRKMMEMVSALDGLRVVDLSSSVAGQFCGRLFADQGADVVLVEPTAGSPLRGAAPVISDRRGEPASALFWHINLGKRSVLLRGDDLVAAIADDADIAGLVRRADVLIVDDPGVATAILAAATADQMVTQITPFGADNPLADWAGGELVFQALSGTMYENGSPGEEPLYGVGHRASYAAGVFAYTESLAVLLGGAPGPHLLDVAVAEVAASMNFSRVSQFSYNEIVTGRDAKETQRAIVRVADGWLGLFVNEQRWAATCHAFGVDDLITDPRFAGQDARRDNWPEFTPVLEERLRDRHVDDLVAAGQAAKAVVARSMSLNELANSPQLLERGYWDGIDTEALPILGPMFELSATPQQGGRAAPRLGSSTAAALAAEWESLPGHRGDSRPPVPTDPEHPLQGIRVLDLTSAWAGPMAMRILAALGADVIKIEGPGRIDDWRGSAVGGHPDRYPDGEPGERPYDRNFQYNTQNQDKRGIVLDLKDPRGRDILLEMAASADVVVANFSAGTLERLGVGWDELSRVNPELVLLEMPAYGSTGPIASYIAYGPSMELMSGIAGIIGYGDGRPTTTGPAYNDPIGGLHGAAASVTALVARLASGRGQHVEVAQRDAAMHWIGEQVIATIVTGREPSPRANQLPDVVPHGAYRTRGSDEWVALAARDDDEFRRLWGVLGLPDPAASGLATLGERLSQRERIDAAIREWASGRDKHEAAGILQAAGVPAAPVVNARDLANSDYLRDRGLLQIVDHREAGRHLYPTIPVHVDGRTHRVRRPAPCFGQDNASVLRELAGVDDETLAQLTRDGVIDDVPRAARKSKPEPVAPAGLA
jgi:crotonobetainyl-CoA:carnitine CoA-transferase CaiB-like acyl-CoA transferase